MNKIYRVIWNKETGTWNAVSEYAKAKGKSSSSAGAGGVFSGMVFTAVRFAYTMVMSGLLIATGQVAYGATGTEYQANTDNLCYYDTTTQSVICGDGSTSATNTTDTRTPKSVVMGMGATSDGESNVAVGRASHAAGTAAIALGSGAQANANAAIAMGVNASASQRNALAMGSSASSATEDSVAIGKDVKVLDTGAPQTDQEGSVAIGSRTEVSGKGSVGIGRNVRATARNAVAIGDAALATDSQAVAIARDAQASGAGAVAMGSASRSTNSHTTALGVSANASVSRSVALGSDAVADRIGFNIATSPVTTDANATFATNQVYANAGATQAAKNAVIATVRNTTTNRYGAVSVGNADVTRQIINLAPGSEDSDAVNVAQLKAATTHYYSVNDGGTQGSNYNNDGATGGNSLAAGVGAQASGISSTAIGHNANASNSASNATAVGAGASATVANSVALGSNSVANVAAGAVGADPLGAATSTDNSTWKATHAAVSVGNGTTVTRQITSVAAGTQDTDAVNVAQLKAAGFTLKATSSTGGEATTVANDKIQNGETVTVDAGKNIKVTHTANQVSIATKDDVSFNSVTAGTGTNAVVLDDKGVNVGGKTYISNAGLDANGKKVTNVADGIIGKDSKDAINGGQLFAQGEGVKNIIGGSTTYDPTTGTYINNNIGGTGKGNINDAIQTVNTKADTNATEIAKGLNFGANDQTATSNTAINRKLGETIGIKGSITDTTIATSGENVITRTDANGNINIELAKNAKFDSVTTGNTLVDNSGITIKAPTTGTTTDVKLTASGLDNGGNKITNVAAGVDATDAVNVSQLQGLAHHINNRIDDVSDDANSGVSSAMAMAALPQAYLPGKSMLTGGIASYNGEGAVAVGFSKLSDNGRWVLKVSGSADTQGNAGGAVGAGFHF